MRNLTNAISNLAEHEEQWYSRPIISFVDFLQEVTSRPEQLIRDIYQVYCDMINTYICDGEEEYGDDPESTAFQKYDCTKLFVDGSDRPFFADRLFANRLMRHVDSFKVGGKKQDIYL